MSLENFLADHKIHCLEGDRGVEALNKVCKEIGYKEDGFRYGSSLENFLKDNTGATQAILNWIGEHYADELAAYSEEDEEDEEDEEENRRDEKNGLYGGKIDIAN